MASLVHRTGHRTGHRRQLQRARIPASVFAGGTGAAVSRVQDRGVLSDMTHDVLCRRRRRCRGSRCDTFMFISCKCRAITRFLWHLDPSISGRADRCSLLKWGGVWSSGGGQWSSDGAASATLRAHDDDDDAERFIFGTTTMTPAVAAAGDAAAQADRSTTATSSTAKNRQGPTTIQSRSIRNLPRDLRLPIGPSF
jgi:hypothetical protein